MVTVARSDYGIYRPILKRIEQEPTLELRLIVGGTHLSPEFGLTIGEIESDGFPVAARVEMLLSSDSPEAVAKSIGLGIIGFAQTFAGSRPDLAMVLGDRFEMLAAATAATRLNVPIAHVHGGESTEGLIDESIRHSITKMAHLHFASTDHYARRIVQMGEEPWRVTVSGAPGLDNIAEFTPPSLSGLNAFGLELSERPLLVTYHPVTLEFEDTERQVRNLMAALDSVNKEVVFTFPNADTSGRLIIGAINDYVAAHHRACVAAHLGMTGYFGLMANAVAMVGNSSSGIIEAASFGLPVVDIGNRQRGRTRGRNVINVSYETADIIDGINRATAVEFSRRMEGLDNPYGDGHAAERIVGVLRTVELDKELLFKRFHRYR